jgi:hypothetical protein
MKFGLAGLGKQDNWTVELDEITGTKLYAMSIHHCHFTLQSPGLPLDRFLELQRFLTAGKQDTTFALYNAPLGQVVCAHHDGRVHFRMLQNTGLATNLLEVPIDATECQSLAKAINEAIEDAESPQ